MKKRIWPAVTLLALLLVAACSGASSDPQPSATKAAQPEMVVFRSPT